MYIRLIDGRVLRLPVTSSNASTGYAASTVELDGRDFALLLRMYNERPGDFETWLNQMTSRFPSNRTGAQA